MKQRIQYLYEEGRRNMSMPTHIHIIQRSLNKSEYIDQISEYDQRQLAK
ncbi:MAG: hypothetical protein ACLTDF_11720 [Coprococcus sp.]